MPDETPKPPAPPAPTAPTPAPPQGPARPPALDLGPGVGINVTQDMATAERKLPPARILLISFFFQAEDGIRDGTVTGVQTCALPISLRRDRGRRTCPGGRRPRRR